jgi:hypothetical protein
MADMAAGSVIHLRSFFFKEPNDQEPA